MNKQIILFCLLLLTCGMAKAQIAGDSILFSAPFYFEDAMGNRDTVYLNGRPGGDHSNPGYLGENIGANPYDPIIEARIYHDAELPTDLYTSFVIEIPAYKNLITPWYLPDTGNVQCTSFPGGGVPFTFGLKAKYWPVTISWPSSMYEEDRPFSCFPGWTLVDNYLHWGADQWWLENFYGEHQYACMNDTNQVTFTNPNDDLRKVFSLAKDPYGVDMNDFDTIRLITYYWYPLPDPPYCADSPIQIISSTRENRRPNLDFSIFPNPASHSLNIQWLEGIDNRYRVRVFSATGQEIFQTAALPATPGEPFALDIQDWPSGMYVVRLEGRDGAFGVRRVVKW